MIRKLRTRRLHVTITTFALAVASYAPVAHAAQVSQPDNQVSVTPSTTMFHPPKVILAPTVACDSPASPWYFPTDPVSVIRQISTWFATAIPVQVRLPKANQNLRFAAYIGPAQLHFADASGTHFTVEPAYYIAKDARGYHVVLVPNIVAYFQNGELVQYLRDRKLYHWLANDSAWQSQYRQESWTTADNVAIHDAKASGFGMPGLNLFPAIPGISSRPLPMGGPLMNPRQNIPGTVESLVDVVGNDRRVTFIEIWNNGANSHQWMFLVGPKGKLLKHTQSGDLPPQDQK